MKPGSLQRLVATSLWLAVGLATAAPASVSAERFAEATLVEPPAWLNLTPETESLIWFAGTATTPGYVAHYRNGTLPYNQSLRRGGWGGGCHRRTGQPPVRVLGFTAPSPRGEQDPHPPVVEDDPAPRCRPPLTAGDHDNRLRRPVVRVRTFHLPRT